MPILNQNVNQAGLVGVLPAIIYIQTNDTFAKVTTAGYLNGLIKQNVPLSENQMALVGTKTTQNSKTTTLSWLQVSVTNGVWSLVPVSSAGEVVLPTIANHLATYTNTTGMLSEDPATAISGGNIQAGLSGTAGHLTSFPATAAKGSLQLIGAASAGNTVTAITNASQAAARTFTIPDGGQPASNFLISDSATTQFISTGSLELSFGNLSVDAGNITVGTGSITAVAGNIIASAGNITATDGNVTAGSSGHAGIFTSFPGTAANGSLIVAGVNAGANNTTTISNGTMGQSTVYTMGDIGASTGGLVVATSAIRMKSVAGATAAGGNAAQSFTDTFCTSASNVVGNWNTQANAESVLKIVPGNGSFVVTSTGDAGAGTFNYIITK